ncbi:haloacid dehalogenase type II [Cryobacterium roopkundense]|uniref:2-haloacid dehalogenase n=1 Tax=Cryobacterium roopkundense TaxID=1001240 RepID=A0A7W9E470_9MICO|nr:haloacid dehalogenase type II [Cryobacterium roopkundense]MBB5640645.1 2-haloacid dehalogenase [Cryobacterium roopkundense]
MTSTPSLIVFDVNETLSDMAPLQARFDDIGVPGHLAHVWFAALLRDGFALAAAGGSAPFAVIGADLLGRMFRDVPLNRDLDEAVQHVMSSFLGLSLNPDIAEGIHALKRGGLRLVTLSNGSAQVAQALLSSGGLRNDFEALLSVDDAPAWKPAPAAYAYAADACGVAVADMLLVAVHPWDIHGAAQAGLRTAWLNRTGEAYPGYFRAPDHTLRELKDLAAALA